MQEHIAKRLEAVGARAALDENGFVIVDDFFPDDVAWCLRGEALTARAMGWLLPNQIRLLHPNGTPKTTVTKPHIYEGDLHDTRLRARPELSKFAHFFSDGCDEVLSALHALGAQYTARLEPTTRGRAIKMQVNDGHGACFPVHVDNPGRPNKRKLTLACYLNPDWEPDHGGEIELLPFLAGPAVRVAPRMNRVVLFASDHMFHRVLPSSRQRVCFTVWFDGADVNADRDVRFEMPAGAMRHDPEGLVESLKLAPIHRLLCRTVYREEFEESIRDCFSAGEEGSEGLRIMLAEHAKHVADAQRNDVLWELVEKLREFKAPRDSALSVP